MASDARRISSATAPVAKVDLRDFGATGDGVSNDVGAFRRALTHLAKIRGRRELIIPDGTYYLMPSKKDAAHLLIEGEEDLTIRGGENTTLVFGSAFHHGVVVSNSEQVHLVSLTLDYKPLPFTQGTVTEVSEADRRFVVELDAGYPRANERHLSASKTKRIVYLFKPGTTVLMTSLHDQYIEELSMIDGTRVALTSRNPVTEDFVGLRAAMVARRRADAVVFEYSSSCSATGVTVHSAPALGFGLRHTDRITLDRCRVQQAPNTDRLMSTNADGIHVKWGRTGPRVLDCHLEGMGDDGINVGGTYQVIRSRPSARTLIVSFHRSLEAGDTIALVRNRTGHMQALPELIRIDRLGGKVMRLHFASDLPPIDRVADDGKPKRADMVIDLDQSAAQAILKRNFIGRNRMRGMIIHGPGALIEGNRFQDMLGPAIRIGHHYRGGLEGPNGSGSIIRNNTFINIQDSPIHVSDRLGDPDVTQRSIENVVISGNRLRGYGEPSVRVSGMTGCAIFIENAQGVQLDGNVIGRPAAEAPSVRRVMLTDAGDISLRGTKVADGALVNDGWLGLGAETDSTTISLSAAAREVSR